MPRWCWERSFAVCFLSSLFSGDSLTVPLHCMFVWSTFDFLCTSVYKRWCTRYHVQCLSLQCCLMGCWCGPQGCLMMLATLSKNGRAHGRPIFFYKDTMPWLYRKVSHGLSSLCLFMHVPNSNLYQDNLLWGKRRNFTFTESQSMNLQCDWNAFSISFTSKVPCPDDSGVTAAWPNAGGDVCADIL